MQRKIDDNMPAVQNEGLLTNKQKYSPALTAHIKNQMITDVVEAQRIMIAKHSDGVDLSDVTSVKLIANEYMKHCADLKITPSMEGLCGALGLGRSWVYEYIRTHGDSETAKYMDRLRTMWVAGKIALAEKGAIDSVMTIFEMKHSKLGFDDTQKLEIITAQNPDPNANRPAWAYGMDEEQYVERLVEGIPDDE